LPAIPKLRFHFLLFIPGPSVSAHKLQTRTLTKVPELRRSDELVTQLRVMLCHHILDSGGHERMLPADHPVLQIDQVVEPFPYRVSFRIRFARLNMKNTLEGENAEVLVRRVEGGRQLTSEKIGNIEVFIRLE
jgi:hypothetical protein